MPQRHGPSVRGDPAITVPATRPEQQHARSATRRGSGACASSTMGRDSGACASSGRLVGTVGCSRGALHAMPTHTTSMEAARRGPHLENGEWRAAREASMANNIWAVTCVRVCSPGFVARVLQVSLVRSEVAAQPLTTVSSIHGMNVGAMIPGSGARTCSGSTDARPWRRRRSGRARSPNGGR